MKHSILKICFLLVAICVGASAWAEDIIYQGTVVDSEDEPLMGAAVKVTGTNISALTDFDGNFTIKVPEGKTVEISYIGFLPVVIKDFSQKTIVMQENAESLEEVVVVGYGTQKKAHLTGSISTVNMDDVQDLANGNLASSLSGLVNGLSVSGGEARPGERATMAIRSPGSLTALGGMDQEPLFVIDGFIYPNDVRVGNEAHANPGAEAFNNLDPSEIESISVLKDAAAAVYGSRAANGVILVTTKRGKEGEPVISYSGTFGWTDEVSRPKMLTGYDYGRLYNAIAAADPTNTTLNPLTGLFQADELQAMRYLNYDLLDKYWSTGFTQKHSVGVSGATGKANYFANISYFDQDGNLGKLDYDRWNYRAGVDVTLKKWIKASIQVSGDYGKNRKPMLKAGGSNSEKDYNLLLTHPRYIPETVNGYDITPYGPSNSRVQNEQDYSFSVIQNSGDYQETSSNNFNLNTSVDYDFGWSNILKGLRLRFAYAKSINNTDYNGYGSEYNIYYMGQRAGSGSHLYTPIPGHEAEFEELMTTSNFLLANNGAPVSNGYFSERMMTKTDNYQMNFNINYNRSFGPHTVGALFSIEKSEFWSEFVTGSVTEPFDFGLHQSSQASGDVGANFSRAESGTLSYIGRVNYAYDDKYLLEFLIRSDASTKFAPENYWGTFPSVSAGWVLSQEDWFRNAVQWINYLKIRASYGVTGRDNTDAWAWLQTYSTAKDKGPIFGLGDNIPSGSMITLNNTQAAINRDAHWDKSYKTNLGIDFNVLNNRLTFNLDGYYNRDRDMLIKYSASVPGTVGTPSAKMNIGKLDSWGSELSVTWRDNVNKDFSYRVTLNTGYSDNKLLFMDWPTNELYMNYRYGYRMDLGMWGLQCIGMFRSFQEIEEYFAKNNIVSYLNLSKDQVRPGMLIYKDVRGAEQPDGTYAGPDGIVSADNDKVCLSNRSNPYHITLNLNAKWRDFSITAQIGANWGGYSYVPGAARKIGDDIEYKSMPSFWNPDNMFVYQDIFDAAGNLLMAANHDGYYPNLAYSSVNSIDSSFWRISGTRVQLNRLTLAYSLPQALVNRVGINKCTFNVTGQNLLSFYNPYPDHFMDPMAGNYGSYPTLRKLTLGVNLSF